MSRKTFDVAEFKDSINNIMRVSTCSSDVRQGLMNALEDVLHSTGNYRGYRYLSETEVPKGHQPGVNDGFYGDSAEEQYENRFKNTDRTRVCYH